MLSFIIKVPLGICLKGEQKYEEMVQVLDHLHQYVPTVSTEEVITDPNSQEYVHVHNDMFEPTLLGVSPSVINIGWYFVFLMFLSDTNICIFYSCISKRR